MTVAVITSVYGAYDQIAPVPEQTIDADWILVTDRQVDAPGWQVVVEPRPHVHPRLAAKVAKCLPWQYVNAATTVWVDASLRFLVPDALEQIVAGAEGAAIAQIVHPWRDCIYDEAHASVGMPKYQGQPVAEQVAAYRKRNYPEHWGLWATGLIVRNGWVTTDLDTAWLAEQVRWTYQDQLSQAPLLWEDEVRPHPLPFPLHGSGVFEWLPHRDEL